MSISNRDERTLTPLVVPGSGNDTELRVVGERKSL